jgi:peptide/nickel transport system permease protein
MGMKWYIARRLAWTVFATWLALTITFGLLALSPNAGEMQAAMSAAQQGGDAEEARENYQERMGLNDPLHERYLNWLTGIVTLNWGWSVTRDQDVTAAIAQAYPYSLQYMLPTIVITTIIGYGLGLWGGMHRNQPSDYAGMVIAFFGISIPNFWFAIMLILVAGVWFQDAAVLGQPLKPFKLPVFYDSDIPQAQGWLSWENIRQLILPIIVLSTGSLAAQMRYSRAQVLEYVNSDFVKTARAKGGSDTYVLFRHILRVALVPLTNILVGTVLAVFFAGSVVIEFIFQIPGLSALLLKAITNNDTPLVLGPVLISTFLIIFGNLIEDVLYTVLDPRVDYGDR